MKTILNNCKPLLSGRAKKVARQLLLVIIAMCVASVFLLLTKYDPTLVFKSLYIGITSDLAGTIRWTTPLLLTSLAVCVTFRAEIFNMGVDGQFYIGAIVATVLAMNLPHMPSILAIVLVMLGGGAAAAVWSSIAAILKIRFRCDEVVTTLLMNYIAYYFTDYLVLGPMLGDGTLGAARSTNYIAENTFLPMIQAFAPSTASVGIYIALAVVFVVAFILNRTQKGYEIRIVGNNPNMAEYGGIRVNATILYVMLLSGFIAGIAGAIEILGVHDRFPLRFSDQLGFDGIVVSLLANNNPFGIILSAFFFGALKTGSINMQRIADVPAAMTDVVQGFIILVVSANFAFKWFKRKKIDSVHMDANADTHVKTAPIQSVKKE